MKITTLLLIVLVAGLAGAPSAAAWVPVSCGDRAAELRLLREKAGAPGDHLTAWKRYEQRILAAEPGDPEYVPHPYPQTDRQVFEDFRHAFLERLVTDETQIEPRHRRTYELLQSGEVRYEVERVENWELFRCGTDRHLRFFHLVRIFDGDTEIARGAVEDSGLFAMFNSLEDGRGEMDDLSGIEQAVHSRFGVKTTPVRSQYVALSGLSSPCMPIAPCVAFQSTDGTFLLDGDAHLFLIEPDAPRLGVNELSQRRPGLGEPSVNANRGDHPWVTVGFGVQEARLVATAPGARSR